MFMPRPGYRLISIVFLLGAILALGPADLMVTALDPGAEMHRLVAGILAPNIVAVDVSSVVLTVAFAVLGVGLGALGGFLLSIVYARSRLVRLSCAFARSVHELFWALILIQVAGLSALTGSSRLPFHTRGSLRRSSPRSSRRRNSRQSASCRPGPR